MLLFAFFDGEDRRQQIVFNVHGAHGFAHLVLVGVRDEQDGFFAVIDLAVGEAGLIGRDHLDLILAGNIGRGDYGEFAPVDLAVEADGANERREEPCCAPWLRATCLRAECRRRRRAAPRSLSTPSLRGTEVPTMRVFAGALMVGEVRNAVRVDA